MKKTLLVFISASIIFTTTYAQTKEVLGSFGVGCTVFNYNFKKTPGGLYSFRLEDPQKETVLDLGNKDSLERFALRLNSLASCGAALRSSGAAPVPVTTGVSNFGHTLASYATAMANGEATIDFFSARRDSIRLLSENAARANIQGFFCDSSQTYGIEGFLKLLDSASLMVGRINDNRTFTLNQFEQDVFVALAKKLIDKRNVLFMQDCPGSVNSEKEAIALFFAIKAKLEFNDDQPATGYLRLKSLAVDAYYSDRTIRKEKGDPNRHLGRFEIEDVQVEFEDGTIKNIFVDVKVKDRNNRITNTTRFQNSFPISISSKTDPGVFERTVLFALHPKDINSEISKPGYIFLSSFLDYQVIAENDREDYSPENCTVRLNKSATTVQVVKEKRSKVLTVRAFTDFIGMQKDEPNGILQFEASKRMNFNTAKYGARMIYYSVLSYVEPLLAFTKIEKQKNALALSNVELDTAQMKLGNKQFNVRAIDLFRYQKFSFDINLNVVKLNLPELKSNLQVNSNIGIMRTNIVDTVNVTAAGVARADEPNYVDVNTFRWGASAIWELKLEGRYGICFGWDFRRLRLLNDSYNIVLSEKRTIHTVWTDAYLKTNDDNKLFFRTRFSFDDDAPKKNFLQMQLGYLVNIFKTQN